MTRRKKWPLQTLAVLALGTAFVALPETPNSAAFSSWALSQWKGRSVARASNARSCGVRYLFQRPFAIRAIGKGVACGKARRIAGAECRIRLNRKWSCVSFRESGPFLQWFLTKELFAVKLTKAIRLERYPCSKADVTPSLFAHHSERFPTRRQMLADDLIRCDMLEGLDADGIEATIGPPDHRLVEDGRTFLYYLLGPERAVIQVDPEYLSVELNEHFEAASIVQG